MHTGSSSASCRCTAASPSRATVIAATDARLLRLPGDEFDALLREHGEFRDAVRERAAAYARRDARPVAEPAPAAPRPSRADIARGATLSELARRPSGRPAASASRSSASST